ncbi:9115_t:CDS:2 [Racocetra fulgida]|uniref:9115_t:CDS:1 n=1 Tax=Racocetra fulgida TaxID=60492 RepID=A0A9N8VUC7_9GLOM|nr:9115_t:CDS:2 [Racocetra fulgida]
MPRPNKRKRLANELPRKRGCFAPRKIVIYEETVDIHGEMMEIDQETVDIHGEMMEIDQDTTMPDETSYLNTIMQDNVDEEKQAGPVFNRI